MNEIYKAVSEESTLEGFVRHLQPFVQKESDKNDMQTLLTAAKEAVTGDFQEARVTLGLEKPPTTWKHLVHIRKRKPSK